MTDFPLLADPQPFMPSELWGSLFPTDEPIEILYQRAMETAKWYACRLPDWESRKEPVATSEHVIMPISRWGASGGSHELMHFPPVEVEAYCMRLTCNWGVVMRGDDCEARLAKAIEEHTGEPWNV